MMINASMQDLIESTQKPFSILEEFVALSPKRKVLLCDHLFIEGRRTFRKTVKLLWPEASAMDMRKLEKFMILLKSTAH